MRLPLLALLAMLLTPLASAQAPDPSPIVDAACALAPVPLPVCPAQPPVPPAPHDHDAAPPAPPAKPQDAQQLAGEAVQQAQGIVNDPPSAPDRIAALVATIVQFVKDLLHLPAAGAAKLDAARHHVSDAAHAAVAHIAALLHPQVPPAPAPHAPAKAPLPGATKRILPKLPLGITASSP